MFRTLAAMLLAVLCGLAVGLGATGLRLYRSPWAGDVAGGRPDARMPEPAAGTAIPRLLVEQPEYDFGAMDFHEKGRREFVFRNLGEAPLVLRAGDTSCRCAVSELQDEEIPPGGKGTVTLTWTPQEVPGPYRQSATIFTNDPSQPRVALVVSGRVTMALRAVPHEVLFSQLSADEPATAEVRLLSTLNEPLRIVGYKLADPSGAGHFEAAFSPLDPDQFQNEPDVQSGVLLRVTVKPGLPQGAFQQTIRLETNLKAAHWLELPVKGSIGSDIAVVGAGWNNTEGVLTLGTVQSQVGLVRRLMLVARGPHRHEVKFKAVVRPSSPLRVGLGETVAIGGGATTQTPLTIEIPQRSRPVNHLGLDVGQYDPIILETTHPKVPQLRILVRYAIEGSQ